MPHEWSAPSTRIWRSGLSTLISTATVGWSIFRIDANTWVDFLEEVKWDDGWKIINVIWENRPHPAVPTPNE
jgi:hypothetical protein